jgi:hypothetical protein
MAKFYLILLLLGSCLQLFAQEQGQSVIDFTSEYMQVAGGYSVIYYGNEYEGYPRATNHPFLKDILFTKAQLS